MLYYVTNNFERAVGINLNEYPEIKVISNLSPLARVWQQDFSDRIILNQEGFLSTLDLLKKYQDELHGNQVIVFKNTIHIERFCNEHEIGILNPSAELGKKIEDKITQHEWISRVQDSGYKMPEARVGVLKDFDYQTLANDLGSPFVLQYNTGHTGTGTKIIQHSQEYENEAKQWPNREAKISQYIKGTMYTINACVVEDGVLCGRTSEQLTGLAEYTDNSLATVGNDWSTVADEVHEGVAVIAKEVGLQLKKDGWKGAFGIDVIVDEDTHDMFLIEINARQTQSVSFETQLAHLQHTAGPMDWQMLALANIELRFKKKDLRFNAQQLFLRNRSGAVYNQYKNISQVGEYGEDLNLIEEKGVFDLNLGSLNIFLIPQATQKEIIRIQQLC